MAGVLGPAALLVLTAAVAAPAAGAQTAAANAATNPPDAVVAVSLPNDPAPAQDGFEVQRTVGGVGEAPVPHGARFATVSAAAFYDPYRGLTRAEIEVFLREAEVVAARPIGTGVTRPWRVTLDDGVLRHDAAVQFVDACERLPVEDHGGATACDSYKYNVAAYEIGKLLGVGSIPPSVERTYAGRPSAFTWWIDDSATLAELELSGRWHPSQTAWMRQRAVVWIFDELINNTDRHQANLLQDPLRLVWMIDHSRAFRPVERLRDPERLRPIRGDPRLLPGLRRLSAAALARCCTAHLTDEERHAVLARRDMIAAIVAPDWPVSNSGATPCGGCSHRGAEAPRGLRVVIEKERSP